MLDNVQDESRDKIARWWNTVAGSAATRKHTVLGQKYFRGGRQTYVWSGGKNIL